LPDRLWRETRSAGAAAPSALDTEGLPEPARRYLTRAMAPGVPPASAVRLSMHGEIRLKGWCRFRAEQVIRADGTMVWQARVRVAGLPVRGYDRLVNGRGAMRWRLLGLVPVASAAGPDITRSAIGRVLGERIWLPSALAAPGIAWRAGNADTAVAALSLLGESTELALTLAADGTVESLAFPRWGDPDGRGYRYETFGGFVDRSATFDGYTIPVRVRVGWYFGSPRFDAEGEFFRAAIDAAVLR